VRCGLFAAHCPTVKRFTTLLLVTAAPVFAASYDDLIAKDQPIAHWNSNPSQVGKLLSNGAAIVAGPRPPEFQQFGAENHAIAFSKPGASVRLKDAEKKFTFKKGDGITLEAWVQCDGIGDGGNQYIIGKGRTGAAGQPSHNQNWALRLVGQDGTARVNFLFHDERNANNGASEFWHRWTSSTGFIPGDGWHHVAVTYKFGEPESVRGYLDGAEVKGTWDMGGSTDLGPVADDGEVWLGSSMGGSATLRGKADEIAIYRAALSSETIKSRGGKPQAEKPESPAPIVNAADLPKGLVSVEVFEHKVNDADAIPGDWTNNDSDASKTNAGFAAAWNNVPDVKTESWTEPAFGLVDLIPKYSPRGVRRDRSIPFLVRMSGVVTLPPGEHRFLVRAMRGGRLSIDGNVVAKSEFFPKKIEPDRASDAEVVVDQAAIQLVQETALLYPGHSEAIATMKGDGKAHVIVFETFVGGKNLRPELGQPSLSVSKDGAPFRLVTSNDEVIEFTDEAWHRYSLEQRARVTDLAATRRANADELAYWTMRHDLARAEIAKKPKLKFDSVDAFIDDKIAALKASPAPLTDDASFLRRATLDTIGLLPTADELNAFLADKSPDKRAKTIDRLLSDVRWADQWIPYWQDVLAENPAILKATLNNTGPFRFFLKDALRDNWPMDRFITALMLMEGSARNGGSAGFAIATQNDLPMANKAQIVSSAFLGMEMKCARCHDAPNHPFDQGDLFSVSAMLNRGPITVPGTSLTQGLNVNSHVVVSLKPGQKIDPHFPFADLKAEPLPGVLRNEDDSREQLAAIITDPRNERFAQVVTNRLWKRLMGFGIVDPVDDWDSARPSHKELVAFLGRELIAHDYDLKHVARLVMNSKTYQRAVTDAASRFAKPDERTFAGQARRRLTAEQLVDSLFQVAGKEFDCEELNLDLDGRRTIKDFLNLGVPQRAWEFAGLSNERDRPSLGKPSAQPFIDVLLNFGWRDSRPEPKSTRDDSANVLQPAIVANGTLGARITRLSDDSAFTALALNDQSLDALITQLFQRVLSREPSAKERAAFTAALSEGYADRVRAVPTGDLPKKPRVTKFAMWSNHLHPDSTPVVYERERIVRAGDPATPRLETAWRERMEDAIWALMLTPEFTYVP